MIKQVLSLVILASLLYLGYWFFIVPGGHNGFMGYDCAQAGSYNLSGQTIMNNDSKISCIVERELPNTGFSNVFYSKDFLTKISTPNITMFLIIKKENCGDSQLGQFDAIATDNANNFFFCRGR